MGLIGWRRSWFQRKRPSTINLLECTEGNCWLLWHRQFLIKQNTPLLMGQILEQRIQNVCWMLTSITVCIRKAKSVKLNLRKPQLISQTSWRTIELQPLWMLSYATTQFYLLFISSVPLTNATTKIKRANWLNQNRLALYLWIMKFCCHFVATKGSNPRKVQCSLGFFDLWDYSHSQNET